MMSDGAPRIGNENTYVGAGPAPSMGDGNTIYTLTDPNGNVLINKGGTAIGAGAQADNTSVAIGARALSGDLPLLAELFAQLRQVFDNAGATEAAQDVVDLAEETQAQAPDERKVSELWTTIKAAATTNEAITLVTRITPLLASAPHHL
jgi:hypothetical protein